MHSGVTKVATERKRSSSSSYRRQAEEEEGGGGGVDDDRKTVSLQPQHRSAALHTNSSSNRTGRTDRQRTTTHAWNNTSSTTPCTSNQSVSLTLALSFSPKKTQHHTRARSHRHCSQNRSSRTKTHTAIFVRCHNKKDGLIFMFLIVFFLLLFFFFFLSFGSFSWTYGGYFGKKEWKQKCSSSKFKRERGKKKDRNYIETLENGERKKEKKSIT